MLKSISAAALLAVIGGTALAQTAVAPAASNYVTTQSSSQSLASGLVNKNVYDAKEEKIGEINDLVLDRSNGMVSAAVIGVGGFLGIGEKNVAVPFQNIKVSMKDSKEWLTLNASKDELKAAPEFKAITPTRQGTVSPSSPGMAPAPAPTRPTNP